MQLVDLGVKLGTELEVFVEGGLFLQVFGLLLFLGQSGDFLREICDFGLHLVLLEGEFANLKLGFEQVVCKFLAGRDLSPRLLFLTRGVHWLLRGLGLGLGLPGHAQVCEKRWCLGWLGFVLRLAQSQICK